MSDFDYGSSTDHFDYGYTGSDSPLPRASSSSYRGGLNLILLIALLLAGFVSFLITINLYTALFNVLPRSILIGIVFAVLTLISSVTVWLVGSRTGGSPSGKAILWVISGTTGMFLLAALLQFLYSLDGPGSGGAVTSIPNATSYVFLIDDSGSMYTNDPGESRYSAINDILADKPESFEYMVYDFGTVAKIDRNMAPKSSGQFDPSARSDTGGGTDIAGALQQVLSDYDNGLWSGGTSPKIILLSDGGSSDSGVSEICRKLSDRGISASTVGFGSADDALMQKIADETGGVYVRIDDIQNLSEAMKSAAAGYTTSGRDLLNTRGSGSPDILYRVLRILFLTILGAALTFVELFIYREDTLLLLISGVLFFVIGSLITEFGAQAGLPMWITLSLMSILFAAFLANKRYKARSRQEEFIRYT